MDANRRRITDLLAENNNVEKAGPAAAGPSGLTDETFHAVFGYDNRETSQLPVSSDHSPNPGADRRLPCRLAACRVCEGSAGLAE